APAELILDLSELNALELGEKLKAKVPGVLLAIGEVGDCLLFGLFVEGDTSVLLGSSAGSE
ncbi:hypothetical protein OFM35_31290, partial [Escherichia coli]|nr:hypothetical protein [Escherichia coli]